MGLTSDWLKGIRLIFINHPEFLMGLSTKFDNFGVPESVQQSRSRSQGKSRAPKEFRLSNRTLCPVNAILAHFKVYLIVNNILTTSKNIKVIKQRLTVLYNRDYHKKQDRLKTPQVHKNKGSFNFRRSPMKKYTQQLFPKMKGRGHWFKKTDEF